MSAYKYWSSNRSIESLNLVFPATVPYNWKTSIGYPITICLQLASIISAVIIFVGVMTVYFGFRQFLLAFVADIEESIQCVERCIVENGKSKKIELKSMEKLQKEFYEMIEFHANAKTLSTFYFIYFHVKCRKILFLSNF